MKRYFQIIIAFALAFLLNFTLFSGEPNDSVSAFVLTVRELIRYFVIYLSLPMLLFSFPVAVCLLRREKRLLGRSYRFAAYTLTAVLTVILITNLVLMIQPFFTSLRLTVRNEETTLPNLLTYSFESLPLLFDIAASWQGVMWLPTLLLLGFIVGLLLYPDREIAEPLFNLFDSISRITYLFNSFVTRWIAFPIFFFTFCSLLFIRQVVDFQRFIPIIVILSLCSLLIIAVFLLLLYLLRREYHPLLFLKSLFPDLLAAAVSGDYRIAYMTISVTLKERLRVERQYGAFTNPLGLLFTRVGTVMVLIVSFSAIYSSYSRFELNPLSSILWRAIAPLLVVLLTIPFGLRGISVALPILFGLYFAYYGDVMLSDGYTIILALLPVLNGFALVIDITALAVVTCLSTPPPPTYDDQA